MTRERHRRQRRAVGKNASVTTLEDTPTSSPPDFGFSDPDGNALLAVRIASLPAAGV
jgi:hypothetical protein